MRTTLLVLALSALVACTHGSINTDDTDVTANTAHVAVKVTSLGMPVDCAVTLVGPKTYETRSGEVIDIEPGTYTVLIGGDALTVDGLRTHEVNGVLWVAPQLEESFDANEDVLLEVPLNRYFAGMHDCEYDKYAYDAGAPDYKGVWQRLVELNRQDITVYEGERVVPESDPDLSVLANVDELFVKGDTFTVIDHSGDGKFITVSSIDAGEWSFTVVNPLWSYVADLRCWAD